ncbi:Hypothetical_protein [Hexamita inflata]|uniref:Hypothetical_protein n=1 Tax=Hexamita inflata TaxID=28002 RepID=A0AA86UMP7_9EUKA|nr:Hypothetical protein HINF_LOCUS52035 [Hexamita inflata]
MSSQINQLTDALNSIITSVKHQFNTYQKRKYGKSNPILHQISLKHKNAFQNQIFKREKRNFHVQKQNQNVFPQKFQVSVQMKQQTNQNNNSNNQIIVTNKQTKQQYLQLTEFMQITQTEQITAEKYLKNYINIESAINAFFEDQHKDGDSKREINGTNKQIVSKTESQLQNSNQNRNNRQYEQNVQQKVETRQYQVKSPNNQLKQDFQTSSTKQNNNDRNPYYQNENKPNFTNQNINQQQFNQPRNQSPQFNNQQSQLQSNSSHYNSSNQNNFNQQPFQNKPQERPYTTVQNNHNPITPQNNNKRPKSNKTNFHPSNYLEDQFLAAGPDFQHLLVQQPVPQFNAQNPGFAGSTGQTQFGAFQQQYQNQTQNFIGQNNFNTQNQFQSNIQNGNVQQFTNQNINYQNSINNITVINQNTVSGNANQMNIITIKSIEIKTKTNFELIMKFLHTYTKNTTIKENNGDICIYVSQQFVHEALMVVNKIQIENVNVPYTIISV